MIDYKNTEESVRQRHVRLLGSAAKSTIAPEPHRTILAEAGGFYDELLALLKNKDAQKHEISELFAKLEGQTSADVAMQHLMNGRLMYYREEPPQNIVDEMGLAIRAVDDVESESIAAIASYWQGMIFSNQARVAEVLESMRNAQRIFGAQADRELLVHCGMIEANAYQYAGDLNTALELLLKLLGQSMELNMVNEELLALANIASIQSTMGMNDAALKIYDDLLKRLPGSTLGVQPKLTTFDNAIHAFVRAGDIDKAFELFEQLAEEAKSLNMPLFIVNSLVDRSELCFNKGEVELAFSFANEALMLAKELDLSRQLVESDEMMAKCLIKLGRPSEALEYIENAFSQFARYESLISEINIVEVAIEAHKALGDSAKAVELLTRALELKTKQWDYRSKKINETSERRVQLERELLKRKADEQKLLIQTVIDTQERVSTEIAADLHDGVGQKFAVMRLWVEDVKRKVMDDASVAAKSIDSLSELLESTTSSVRLIAHRLSNVTLEHLGLNAALHELVSDIPKETGIFVDVHTSGLDDRIENKIELALFRCVQIMLTNVIRHANASEATIQIVRHADQIVLMVEDDGIGFDASAIRQGMGLSGVQARIGLIGGEIDIDSSPGHGTTITIRIPLEINS